MSVCLSVCLVRDPRLARKNNPKFSRGSRGGYPLAALATQRGREIGFSRQWRPTQKQRATVLSAGGAPDATGLNPSRRRLRPGPRPARHLDFHSPDALSLRCRLPQERLAIDSVLPVVGWESTERLECNCVREIGLGNKHSRSIGSDALVSVALGA